MPYSNKNLIIKQRRKKNLPDMVSRQIRKQILSGDLKTGTHLNEVAIAEELGVSRSPVREALKMMENEGLIETLPTGRTLVTGFTLKDLRDLYDLRLDLEWKAIKPLHEQNALSFEEMGELELILGFMERKTTTLDEYQHLDTMFHRTLIEASQNRPLIRVWSTMIQTILTLQDITNEEKDQEFFADVVDNHREIFASIKEGNKEETYRLLEKHTKDGFDIVSQVLEKNMMKKIQEEKELILNL